MVRFSVRMPARTPDKQNYDLGTRQTQARLAVYYRSLFRSNWFRPPRSVRRMANDRKYGSLFGSSIGVDRKAEDGRSRGRYTRWLI